MYLFNLSWKKINKIEMKYTLLKEVVGKLEDYESVTDSTCCSLTDFAEYILQNQTKEGAGFPNTFNIATEDAKRDYNTEVETATLLTTMFKFTKHYVKRALQHAPIHTIDEFGFLTALLQTPALTKTELIQRNQLEIPSGNEIIRRLLKAELLSETADLSDKRSKLVSLTEKGRTVLFAAFTEMHKVAHVVTGALSGYEKTEFLLTLKKLRRFHERIHASDKNTEIDLILKKYL